MEMIDAKALLVGAKVRYTNNKEMQEALNIAINAVEKQIPKKPKVEPWCPALCPGCGEELSESLGDGYYKHYYNLIICNCGQKLKWD